MLSVISCQTTSTEKGIVNSEQEKNLLSVGESIQRSNDWQQDIIYFVVLDRFADGKASNNQNVSRKNPGGFHGGDFVGLMNQLDYLQKLGITTLWITPIVQQIRHDMWANGANGTGWEAGFDHAAYHGYWAEDFTAIDPRFGTKAEFIDLVKAAHNRGIKILLDVVYNHPGYGSQYVTEEKWHSWIRKEVVDCEVDPLVCQVGGLPDFKTERGDVRDFLIDAMVKLAKETGIDGFRLDTVKHVEHDFWQLHRKRLSKEVGEDFFLLGEVWGGSAAVLDSWFENDEIDAGFDFTFRGNCEAFVNGNGRSIAFAKYLEKRHRVREGYFLSHYLSSHDEPMMLHNLKQDKNKFRLCVALQMTTLGIPVIYYGEEVGRKGGDFPLNRSDMPWGSANILPGKGQQQDVELLAFYKQWIQIRKSYSALSQGKFQLLTHNSNQFAFARTLPRLEDSVIVLVNRERSLATLNFRLPEKWQGLTFLDVRTQAKHTASTGNLITEIPPLSVVVLKPAERFMKKGG